MSRGGEYGQIMDIMSDDTRQLFSKGAALFLKLLANTMEVELTEDEMETAIRFGTLVKVLSLGEDESDE